jgi:hypothetical protein
MKNKIRRLVRKNREKRKIQGASGRWGLKEKNSGIVLGAGEKVIQLISEIDKEIFPGDPAKVKFYDGTLFDNVKYSLNRLIEADEEELTQSFLDHVRSLQISAEVMKTFYQEFSECVYILYNEDKKTYEISKISCEKGSITQANTTRHILPKKHILTHNIGWKKGPNFTPEEVCMADAGRVVRLRVATEGRASLFKWTDRDKAINPELKAILTYISEKYEYKTITSLFDTGVFFYLLSGLWRRGIRDSRVLAEIVKADAKKLLERKSFSSSFYFLSLKFCFLKMNYYSANIYYLQYNVSCNRKKAKSLYTPFCR